MVDDAGVARFARFLQWGQKVSSASDKIVLIVVSVVIVVVIVVVVDNMIIAAAAALTSQRTCICSVQLTASSSEYSFTLKTLGILGLPVGSGLRSHAKKRSVAFLARS